MNRFDRIKEKAEGRWRAILGDLYPDFAPALKQPGKSRMACPVAGSSKAVGDGFRFFDDFDRTGGGVSNACGSYGSGIDIVCWREGGDLSRALQILEDYLGIDQSGMKPTKALPPRVRAKTVELSSVDIRKREETLEKIWSQGVELSTLPKDHFAIEYLKSRGISARSVIDRQRMVRFNPKLYYRSENEKGQNLPGLISLFHSSEGNIGGLHRTFLAEGQPRKAEVNLNKKMLRRLDRTLNGGIRLQGSDQLRSHINLCEGVETGLSICFATGKHVIACTTATLLSAWTPLEGTRFVTIWADHDENRAGLNHAENLQARLDKLGIGSRILLPTFDGHQYGDWNDVLNDKGYEEIARAYSIAA